MNKVATLLRIYSSGRLKYENQDGTHCTRQQVECLQDLQKVQDRRQLLTEVPNRPGIVHHLDKGTSGVIIVAKTTAALQALSEMFAQRKVRKTVGVVLPHAF